MPVSQIIDRVEIGTQVELEVDDHPRVYTVIDEPSPQGANFITSRSPLGRQLLGRRPQESFEYRLFDGSQVHITVTQVKKAV
jgi:transcription elongation GreA/GreB family factor